jgi:hypothetical protein
VKYVATLTLWHRLYTAEADNTARLGVRLTWGGSALIARQPDQHVPAIPSLAHDGYLYVPIRIASSPPGHTESDSLAHQQSSTIYMLLYPCDRVLVVKPRVQYTHIAHGWLTHLLPTKSMHPGLVIVRQHNAAARS